MPEKPSSSFFPIVLFVLLCMTAGIGAHFSMDQKYDVEPELYERQLRIVKMQLEDLKHHLVKYRERHNRYPTNDEGLAVLEFEARFRTQLDLARPDWRNYEMEVDCLAWELSDFREKHGRYPSSEDELSKIGLWPLHVFSQTATAPSHDLAVSGEGNFFLVSEAGILSPWMVPYIYENRAGLSPDVFKDSPATRDTDRNYSVQVDKDVFVYCVGAMQCFNKQRSLKTEMHVVRGVSVFLFLLFLVMFAVSLVARAKRLGIFKTIAVGAAMVLACAVAFFVGTAPRATCYMMGPFRHARSPQMLSAYSELLDKYHSTGVIKTETYNKIKAELNK